MPKSTRTSQTPHDWRVYKIRKKLELLGHVRAATEMEAIDAAAADYQIPTFDRHRIIVRREPAPKRGG